VSGLEIGVRMVLTTGGEWKMQQEEEEFDKDDD
jgi:hypothetical protein